MRVLRTIQTVEIIYTLIYFVSSLIVTHYNFLFGVMLLVCVIYNSLGIFFYEFDGDLPPKNYNPDIEIGEIITNKVIHSLFVVFCMCLFIISDDYYFRSFCILVCCLDVFLSDKNVKLYREE